MGVFKTPSDQIKDVHQADKICRPSCLQSFKILEKMLSWQTDTWSYHGKLILQPEWQPKLSLLLSPHSPPPIQLITTVCKYFGLGTVFCYVWVVPSLMLPRGLHNIKKKINVKAALRTLRKAIQEYSEKYECHMSTLQPPLLLTTHLQGASDVAHSSPCFSVWPQSYYHSEH